ncbi:hypothetical protein BDV96DRAFT_592058 [Lophiotrema nucula]|uniref:Uncharacterized protein n=1 Tax=Lophiotrema nucula TaxID=690887 RepID=A0A6A5YFK1_9PLEO|nr:hypothetical protein BDV96DRAFT_592058 [Lophiotrema nucula]
MLEFRRHVVAAAFQILYGYDTTPSASQIHRAYENLPRQSPFIRLLVHHYCDQLYRLFDADRFKAIQFAEQYPQEFLVDVWIVFSKKTKKGGPNEKPKHLYSEERDIEEFCEYGVREPCQCDWENPASLR